MTSALSGGWGCPDPDCALSPPRLALLARRASRRSQLLTAAAFRARPPGLGLLGPLGPVTGGEEARPSRLSSGQLCPAVLAPETTPGPTM